MKQRAFFENFLELHFGLPEFCPSLLGLVYAFQNCICGTVAKQSFIFKMLNYRLYAPKLHTDMS